MFKEEKCCLLCYMILKDIVYVGKFGCVNCYVIFKDDIIDIVCRV